MDKPTEEKNLNGETVLVNQVGWAGINLGRIDFEIDSKVFAKKRYYKGRLEFIETLKKNKPN